MWLGACLLRENREGGWGASNGQELMARLEIAGYRMRIRWTAFDTLWRKLREERVTSAMAERVVHVVLEYFFLMQFSIEEGSAMSQNHRMGQVGKDHSESSGPTSLLKQGYPTAQTQDCIQTALEYLQ